MPVFRRRGVHDRGVQGSAVRGSHPQRRRAEELHRGAEGELAQGGGPVPAVHRGAARYGTDYDIL